MKNAANPNNINGYVVKLTNGAPTSDIHFHYSCLYRYLLNGHTDINDGSILDKTIHDLLHIAHDKADALTGSDFYR
jgi:hypothetical protein